MNASAKASLGQGGLQMTSDYNDLLIRARASHIDQR